MPNDTMMRAMVLEKPGERLRMQELPIPTPGPEGVLIRVHACGVCRTDLHIIDGELPHPKLPLIPGHEIIGTIVEKGEHVDGFSIGQRIGFPGLDIQMDNAAIAERTRKISAIMPSSLAIPWMGVMLTMQLLTTGIASLCHLPMLMQRLRHSCVLG